MAQTNLIGKNILGYAVSEKLGSGAFGTVYKVIKTNAAGQYVRALKHITIPTEKQYNSVLNSMGGDVSKADNYLTQMLNNIVSEIRILNDLSEKGVQHIVRYYENDILVTGGFCGGWFDSSAGIWSVTASYEGSCSVSFTGICEGRDESPS